jgi:hypothetical protein
VVKYSRRLNLREEKKKDLTVHRDNKISVQFLLVYRGLYARTVCSLPQIINNFRQGDLFERAKVWETAHHR